MHRYLSNQKKDTNEQVISRQIRARVELGSPLMTFLDLIISQKISDRDVYWTFPFLPVIRF